MAKQRSLKTGGPRLNSPNAQAGANGIVSGKKVNAPFKTTGAMDEMLRYEPIGGNINPSKTAIIGARARGL